MRRRERTIYLERAARLAEKKRLAEEENEVLDPTNETRRYKLRVGVEWERP
jgi:hypothetical protein